MALFVDCAQVKMVVNIDVVNKSKAFKFNFMVGLFYDLTKSFST
jgi:hypothetical protein